MEDETITTAEAGEAGAESAADWDDWSDLESMDFTDTDNEDFNEELTAGADQPAEETAEEAEETEAEAEPSAETETQEAETETERKSWTLKHLDETVEADEARMVELAQKGLDYDRVREKYDSANNELKEYREKKNTYAEYEAFLNELAENSGQSIDDLIDSSRARMLIASERAENRTMSEMQALQEVQRRRREAAQMRADNAPKEAETSPTPQEQQRKMFMDFVAEFPGVDPKDIPQDVFTKARESGNLVSEYRNYIKNQQEDEIKRLKAENEKLKQDQKNRARSTGSMKSAGSAQKRSVYDELWYDGT